MGLEIEPSVTPGADITTVTDGEKPVEKQVEQGHDVEIASIDDNKGQYSKLSVWLMVLFSGLAIGSDG